MDNIEMFNSLYGIACKHKDKARISHENFDDYHTAAKYFLQASSVAQQILSDGEISLEIRSHFEVDYFYSLYEQHECTSIVYYEQRDKSNALKYRDKAKYYLKKAIEKITDYLKGDGISVELLEELKRKLAVYKYFESNDEVKRNSILARDAWDNERFVDALDLYRLNVELASNTKAISTKFVQEGILSPIYMRVAFGNHIGMMANISSAMAQIIHSKGSNNNGYREINEVLGKKLLEYLLESYQLGLEAYHNNPEWEQYQIAAEKALKNIRSFLWMNRDHWNNIYIQYGKSLDIKSIMCDIDSELFNKVERELGINKSPENSLHFAPQFNVINVDRMVNSTIQQATEHSSQIVSNNPPMSLSLMTFVSDTQKLIAEIDLSNEDRKQVESDLNTILTQIVSPSPKVGIIDECVKSIQSVIIK